MSTPRHTASRTAAGPRGRAWFALAAGLVAASPLAALEVALPAACTPGETCHIVQIVDRDPGSEHADFTCGSLSYDGHDGTDIGLPSWAAMRAGVEVLAAAPGRVRAMRDGMQDRPGYRQPNGDIEDRECGNGVLIDHADGWQTQYCHFRQGSVLVRNGDTVERGQPLGLIGASGKADFPHVHLVVRKGQEVIDPFDGQPAAQGCESGDDAPLWSADTPAAYQPGGLLSSGFLGHLPEYEEIWNLAPAEARLAPDAGALVFWAHFYGLRAGDALEIRITGPDGAGVAEGTHVMDRNRATEFRAVGRRTPEAGWPPGRYAASARLVRDGGVIDAVTGTTEVP